MVLKTDIATCKYKNLHLEYISFYWQCDDSKEIFTTTELDETNLESIGKEYSIKSAEKEFKKELLDLRNNWLKEKFTELCKASHNYIK